MSPAVLETHYARLIEASNRAARWAAERDAALARQDRTTAEFCLTRYWMAVRTARDQLALAWPGLEIFARRTLAGRKGLAGPLEVERLVEQIRRGLSHELPAVPGIPALYGRIRRLARQSMRAAAQD